MSNALGAVYRVPSGDTGESLGLPTFADCETIDQAGLLKSFISSNGDSYYNGVVALEVMRATESGTKQVLVGIRTDANETHPDVISVPTEVRALEDIAASLSEDSVQARPIVNALVFDGHPLVFRRTRHCYSSKLGEMATHALAIKLNLGDRVEDLVIGGAQFRYQNLYLGFSKIGYDPSADEDLLEGMAMLNIGVTIPAGYEEIFPSSSSELHSLTWVSESDFVRGLEERDPAVFFGEQLDDESAAGVCVHGLCLVTTALAIKTRRAAAR